MSNPLIHSPIKIGKLELKNRLVMPPMATERSNPDGTVSDALLEYYRPYAEGYIGLIIVEHSFVHLQGRASAGQLSVSRDSDIEGLSRLAEVLKANGTKAFMQINHAGGAAREVFSEEGIVAPSGIPNPRISNAQGVVPKELDRDGIKRLAILFADAAERAKKAGFDGVEVHMAHGYLLNQFYSAITNKREDEYGGSLENRMRAPLEVLRAVRERVGDFTVVTRLGGCDYAPESGYLECGNTEEDAARASKMLEEAGSQLIDLTGGMSGYNRPEKGPGWFRDMSRAVKNAVSVPVAVTGGITEIGQAERLLEEGAADLVGVGRAMLKDSGWAKKNM